MLYMRWAANIAVTCKFGFHMIPIAFKNEPPQGRKTVAILAADIGGTKTNVAWYQSDGNGLTITRERTIRLRRSSFTDRYHP